MENITCNQCGIVFGVPDGYLSNRREDHRTFLCPNGHGLWFPSKTDAEKYKERVDILQKKLNTCNTELSRIKVLRDIRGRFLKRQK